jgi:pimeloyl-ACP methyl ester carboxylesterase
MRLRRLLAVLGTLLLGLLAMSPVTSVKAAPPTTFSGSLADGATYLIQVPSAWNGTLVLYSHGYVVPGSPNPARDVGDPVTGAWLLANGYALAGSSYSTTGWALQQALPDQIATLDKFDALVGQHPTRTIAWGHSLGGIITAGLIQRYPDRFTAALPMCGVLAGGVATWNQALDGAFALQQLVGAGTPLQVVNITNPFGNLGLAEGLLAAAQATPAGRARIALSSALSDTPGWFTPLSPEPAANDYAGQENAQFLWQTQVDAPFAYLLRAELEARAGGNPSWNTGVDYQDQLAKSVDRAEVKALYKAAGLSLDADIDQLNAATRISANPSAVGYLTDNIVFNGDIDMPVLTMHTTGDGLVVNQDEQAYERAVGDAKDSSLLRQTFVHRAGHCTFTPAETVTAFQTLINRLDTGRWSGTAPGDLNAAATQLGPGFNLFAVGNQIVPTPPAFLHFKPTKFLRPFDIAGTS